MYSSSFLGNTQLVFTMCQCSEQMGLDWGLAHSPWPETGRCPARTSQLCTTKFLKCPIQQSQCVSVVSLPQVNSPFCHQDLPSCLWLCHQDLVLFPYKCFRMILKQYFLQAAALKFFLVFTEGQELWLQSSSSTHSTKSSILGDINAKKYYKKNTYTLLRTSKVHKEVWV